MGKRRMGPPERVVLELRRWLDIGCFVETGTFRGDTARWAASHFREVVSIEASPELHAEARRRLRDRANIELRLGDSRLQLRATLRDRPQPCLFWLDAHWSGGPTHGEASECPLLDELSAVNGRTVDDAILVDDARCFAAPPPAPHRAEAWPDLTTVVSALSAGGRRAVYLFDDVFLAVPHSLAVRTRELLQAEATVEWRQRPRGGRLRRWLREHL